MDKLQASMRLCATFKKYVFLTKKETYLFTLKKEATVYAG